MLEISKSMFINRAAVDIFAYVTNADHVHEWQEDTIAPPQMGNYSSGRLVPSSRS